jgi:uncharacterized delta-60 repeat protein
MDSQGRFIITGTFTNINGSPRQNIGRLLSDGALDTNFVATVNDSTGFTVVRTVQLQSDGKILIAGNFDSVNGTDRPGLARLEADGSLDTSFDPWRDVPGFNGVILALKSNADQSVFIGGIFGTPDGSIDANLARLTRDGRFDRDFRGQFTPADVVQSLAETPNGKLLVGGRVCGSTDPTASCNGVLRFDIAIPLRLGSPRIADAGTVEIILDGTVASRTYVLLASSNLLTWFPACTNSAISSQTLLMDSDARFRSQRFYRAVEEQ